MYYLPAYLFDSVQNPDLQIRIFTIINQVPMEVGEGVSHERISFFGRHTYRNDYCCHSVKNGTVSALERIHIVRKGQKIKTGLSASKRDCL